MDAQRGVAFPSSCGIPPGTDHRTGGHRRVSLLQHQSRMPFTSSPLYPCPASPPSPLAALKPPALPPPIRRAPKATL